MLLDQSKANKPLPFAYWIEVKTTALGAFSKACGSMQGTQFCSQREGEVKATNSLAPIIL